MGRKGKGKERKEKWIGEWMDEWTDGWITEGPKDNRRRQSIWLKFIGRACSHKNFFCDPFQLASCQINVTEDQEPRTKDQRPFEH